jgi:hypothetical protein
MKTSTLAPLLAALLLPTACWDRVEHICDCDDTPTRSGAHGDGDADTDGDTDADGDSGTDDGTDANSDNLGGQGNRPEGWEQFGAACETNEDCAAVPGGGRCLFNIISMINVPGGYCTACCDTPGYDVCAPGIDCVGVDEVYLVCLAHCDSNEDCRTEDHYECRPIYYLDTVFEGNYCLPDVDHVEPDPTAPASDPECDWPWM